MENDLCMYLKIALSLELVIWGRNLFRWNRFISQMGPWATSWRFTAWLIGREGSPFGSYLSLMSQLIYLMYILGQELPLYCKFFSDFNITEERE